MVFNSIKKSMSKYLKELDDAIAQLEKTEEAG